MTKSSIDLLFSWNRNCIFESWIHRKNRL